MSIATVVTRGYGSFGTIPEVVTRGYSLGVAAVPPITASVMITSGSASITLRAAG